MNHFKANQYHYINIPDNVVLTYFSVEMMYENLNKINAGIDNVPLSFSNIMNTNNYVVVCIHNSNMYYKISYKNENFIK
jgi:hypothetical protein